MGKRIYHIAYSGLNKDERISCREYIRRLQNPPGSTNISLDGLCRSNRDSKKDALTDGKKLDLSKFVDIGRIDF